MWYDRCLTPAGLKRLFTISRIFSKKNPRKGHSPSVRLCWVLFAPDKWITILAEQSS